MLERVIVVTTSYPRVEGDPSGHFVRAEALALAEGGAEVRVLALGAERSRRDGPLFVEGAGGATLFDWPGAAAALAARPWRVVSLPPVLLRARRRVTELARAPRSRVVAHWAIPSALPIAEACAAPLHAVSHGADLRLLAALPRRAREVVVARLCRRVHAWTFASASLRDELAASLSSTLAARLLALSDVALPRLELPSRAELPDPRTRLGLERTRYAIWLGRDVPSKRAELAARAARRAGRSLVLVGAPDPGAGAHVRSVGRLGRDEALGLLVHADALVSTSALEAAPTAVREARAYGVPVIACPAGDVVRWAERDAGIHVVTADEASIAAALARLVAPPTAALSGEGRASRTP